MGYRLLLLSLLAATLAYLVLARQIPLDLWSAEEMVNSRTLPTVYGVFMVVTLLLLLLHRPPHVRFPRHVGQAVLLFALAAAFVWIMPDVGVWIALGGLLVGAFLIMGERHPATVLSLGIGVPAVGWLSVEYLLGIYVPGPWS